MDPQISAFLRRHFRHFNSATVIEAADGWRALIGRGGRMILTMAGAMSTARIGLSLAELIRRGHVHAICCTGANLEEDLFNIVGRPDYVATPEYRDLRPEDEAALVGRGLSRITDVCVPREVFTRVEEVLKPVWLEAHKKGERYFPHEFLFRLIREGRLNDRARLDWSESWLAAASERNLPVFVPGWEDSTLGNAFAAMAIRGDLGTHTVKTGIEYMSELAKWYEQTSGAAPIGFFQIGGGITGDFAICVVPMLTEDLKRQVPMWSYFCQISDSTTSYGSYSGAPPREKITWAKLAQDTPAFVIESDATIVFPLVAALVLGL